MKSKDPNKEKSIFEATIELVSEIGLSGLKMSDIARKSKVANGTLYIYFSSKDELLNTLYQKLKLNHPLMKATDILDDNLPLRLKIKTLWDLSLRYGLDHHKEKVFLEQFVVSPFIDEKSKSISKQAMIFFNDLLDKGKKDTLIKEIDNLLLIGIITGLLRETISYCESNIEKLSDNLIDETFTICWDALKV